MLSNVYSQSQFVIFNLFIDDAMLGFSFLACFLEKVHAVELVTSILARMDLQGKYKYCVTTYNT